MLRKTGLFTVLATLALAAPLHAEEHYVLLLDTGYFPDVVYPDAGDTIKFVNQGELPMAASATDLSWSTGLLTPGSSFDLPVVEGMTMPYNNLMPGDVVADVLLGISDNAGTIGQVIEATGKIDYVNDAPVDLGADGKPLMLADESYNQ